jgi:hypothetical protein
MLGSGNIGGNCGGVDVDDGVKLALGFVIELGINTSTSYYTAVYTMRDIDILDHIAKTGKCPYNMCLACPLSKLRKREDGSEMSCYATIMCGQPIGNTDELYKQKAKEVLANLLIELALGGKHEGK